MGEHVERLRFAGRGGAVRRGEIAALPARLFHLLVVDDDQPARDRRRLLRAMALGRRAARGDLAVMQLGQAPRFLRLGVAGDDHDGVFRRVEARVIGERVLAARPSISWPQPMIGAP